MFKIKIYISDLHNKLDGKLLVFGFFIEKFYFDFFKINFPLKNCKILIKFKFNGFIEIITNFCKFLWSLYKKKSIFNSKYSQNSIFKCKTKRDNQAVRVNYSVDLPLNIFIQIYNKKKHAELIARHSSLLPLKHCNFHSFVFFPGRCENEIAEVDSHEIQLNPPGSEKKSFIEYEKINFRSLDKGLEIVFVVAVATFLT